MAIEVTITKVKCTHVHKVISFQSNDITLMELNAQKISMDIVTSNSNQIKMSETKQKGIKLSGELICFRSSCLVVDLLQWGPIHHTPPSSCPV